MKKSAPNRQRGSIMVPVVVSLLVGLILLGGVQLGYYFHLKRELQNTADLAALSGVQLLSEGGNVCNDAHPAKKAAIANIKENFKQNDAVNADGSPRKLKWTVSCGTWDPAKEKADQDDPTNSEKGEYRSPQYFEAELNSNNKFNALRVILSYEPPIFIPTFSSFFGRSPSATTISVEAIAKSNEPVAAFQIGSQLLRFDNNSLLGRLLKQVGLDIESLTVLDSDGVANATISPSGLLKALGLPLAVEDLNVLTPEGIANAQVSLSELLVKLSAVEKFKALSADLGTLRTSLLELGIDQIQIPIFDTEENPGLFAFINAGGGMTSQDAALDVELELRDVLNTAIAIGANGHALEIPSLNVLNLIKAKLSVVEPPVIAIGPVGTTGHTAQVRLWLDIDTGNILENIPVLGWLVSLVTESLDTRVHLPVVVDVVSATGTLEKLQCSRQPPTMDVSVVSTIMNVCVGEFTEDTVFSKEKACHNIPSFKDTLRPELIKLLGIPVLSGRLHIPAVVTDPAQYVANIAVGETKSTEKSKLPLGNTVDGVVDGLLELLSGLFSEPSEFPEKAVWDGDYKGGADQIAGLALPYLEASKKADRYVIGDVDTTGSAINLIVKGRGNPDDSKSKYLPPLLKDNFEITYFYECYKDFTKTTCSEVTNFSDVFYASTAQPAGVLDWLLGDVVRLIFGGEGKSCNTLFTSNNKFNQCVEDKLNKLLNLYPNYVNAKFDSDQGDTILTDDVVQKNCSGLLCVVLTPIVELLKEPLNLLGGNLSSLLAGLLGLELGRTDVTALAIDCDPAQLVY